MDSDFFFGFAACVVAIAAISFGFSMGKSTNASQCDDFGMFRSGDVVYVCHKKESK